MCWRWQECAISLPLCIPLGLWLASVLAHLDWSASKSVSMEFGCLGSAGVCVMGSELRGGVSRSERYLRTIDMHALGFKCALVSFVHS